MKLVSFTHDGVAGWGVLRESRIFEASALFGTRAPDLRSALEQDLLGDLEATLSRAPQLVADRVTWQPVIPNPQKILCVGLNYQSHRLETGRAEAAHPTIFTRFADTQVGHRQPLVRPRISDKFDYEGELAVVIGRAGRYIPRSDALRYVAGYACYMDATVRDWQHHTHQFTPGKNFPGTGGFGPMLVTPDEVGELAALELTTRLNGNAVQSGRLEQLIFPVATLIEYCSAFTALAPGDVIATGTPGGVGFKRVPPLFLKAGDVVEVEISKLGTLRHTVRDEGAVD